MRRSTRHNLARLAIAGATLVVAAPLPAQTDPPEPARLASEQVATLARRMSDPAGDQDARDLAARRLLTIGRPEARAAIALALGDPANPGGRLAAARAVADDLPADPQFVDPLFNAIESPQPRGLADAAAVALANHKLRADVGRRLVGLAARDKPEAVRLAAIRAMAGQADKAVAERLVQLVADPSPAVAAAAIASLQAFAALPLATAGEWADWWRGQASSTDDRFKLDLLAARAARLEGQARRGEDTYQELRRSVLAQLAGAPRDQMADAMAKLLASPRDAVRLIAARQAYALATTGDLAQSLRPAMRSLLADPLADVRVEAARTVPLLGDVEGSFDALARQVAVEPDARVRVELVRAIGAANSPAAVAVLSAMLDDRAAPVVQAAAQALAAIGPTLAQQSPGRAADLADRLQNVLRARIDPAAASDPSSRALREALVEALVPLRQRTLRPMYRAMLAGAPPREPESIRALAAKGLAAMADGQNVDLLAESLGDESPAVRLEVVRALRASSNEFSLVAEPLYRRMDPSAEPDERVRAAAWEAIRSLLPGAPREQLAAWPERPMIRGDQAKRLELFAAMAAKAEAAGDKDGQSSALQQAGDAQRALGEAAEAAGDVPGSVARYAEATANYRKALAISRAQGRSMVVEHLVESTVRSLLRGRDYAGAAAFAADLFAGEGGRAYQGSIGYEFKQEAARLSKSTDRQDDALRLIGAAIAMPSFPSQFRDPLLDIQREVLARQRGGSDAWSLDPTIGLATAR